MKKLKIGIFGAGALGSLIGAYLSDAHEVTLYGRKDHIEAINKYGLRVSGIKGDKQCDVKADSDFKKENFDLAVIAVKGYDNEKMLNLLKENEISFDLIASIQNGLKDQSLIADFGLANTLGCVIDEAAKIVEPGHVVYTNNHRSYFGCLYPTEKNRKKKDLGEVLAETLREKELVSDYSEELYNITWYKFMSSALMAVSGALNFDLSQLYTNPYSTALFLKIVEEVVPLAKSEGIPLIKHPMLHLLFSGDDKTRKAWVEEKRRTYLQMKSEPHLPSLVQDLRKGKAKTEAEFLFGTMLDYAAKHNQVMPVMEICYKIVQAKEFENARKL